MNAEFIFLQICLAFIPGQYISIFLHELGHALVAKWVGFDVTSFGMGLGRPLLVFSWRDTRVYLCWSSPHTGFTFCLSRPDHEPTKGQRIAFLLAGIIAQLFLCLLCLVFWHFLAWGAWFWATLGVLTALIALESLIPFSHLLTAGRYTSDGTQVLDLLRGKVGQPSVMDSIRRLQRFRKLWQAVGDRRAEADALHSAGAAWNILGDSEYSEILKSEAKTIDPRLAITSDIDQLWEQGSAEKKAGRFDEAAEAYAKAQELWTARNGNIANVALLCSQATLAEARGQLEEATALLLQIDSHPLVAVSPYAKTVAVFAWLTIMGKHLNVEQLHDLHQKYDRLDSQGMAPEWDWLVYCNLAHWYAERQEWEQAEVPAVRAGTAAMTLWQCMPSLEDRQRFAKLASEFQQRTVELFTRLRRYEEADKASAWFKDDTKAKEAEQQAVCQREERYQRLGWYIMGINALVGGIGLAGATFLSPVGWGIFALRGLSIVLLLFLVFTLIYLGLYFLVRLVNPNHRETPGTTTLALTIIPWLVWALVAVLFPVVIYFVA